MGTTDGLIVSVSGIRGVVGRSLTPAVALAYALAPGGAMSAAAASSSAATDGAAVPCWGMRCWPV